LFNQAFAQGFFCQRFLFIRVIHNLHMQFSTILTSIALLGVLTLSANTPAQAQAMAGNPVASDANILEMNQAFKKGNSRRLSELLPLARGHTLEPWAAYWELRARLDTATPAEIQQFLNRFAGTYQEDRLRNDWLLLLGQRQEWGTFMAEYPNFRMKDDRSVQCYALLTEFKSSDRDVAQQVEALWLAQRDADLGCAAAAEQQLKARKLQPQTVWLRARLGFENNNLRIATQAVGLLNAEWANTVSAIYSNPEHYLEGKLLALRLRTKELVTLAMIRLAVKDPAAAAVEIDKLRWKTQLSQEERSWVWGVIGKRSAMRLSDDALAYFLHGQDRYMQDDQLAWKVRAALRAGDWAQVAAATAAMGEAQSKEASWTYWRARALQKLAKTEPDRVEARRLLQSIASVRGFYEQLALEELGQRISAPARPEPLTQDEKDAARLDPGLDRSLYAIQIGLRSEGVREWNYSVNMHQRGGMSDRELLACQHEVWDRCINTSERTKNVIDFAQRFPMPHKDAVLQRSSEIGLDPAYVYGLIRQESRFIMDARSGVGAAGLMQVMPATARWTAKKIGLVNFKPQQLSERDTNIAIGTGYLKLVLDSFDGSMPMAAAAYNAGPGRPRSWRGQAGAPALEAAIWAENVPFTETRDYVKKVLSNTTSYAALISGQPQSLKSRLGLVGPRDAGAPLVNSDLP
jgi:soluble lytic murein transglycosylase